VLDRRFAGAVTFYRVQAAWGEVVVQGGAADAAPDDGVLFRPRGGAASLLVFPGEGA
jgi:formylmethanofuran dehydrogenase subunit D